MYTPPMELDLSDPLVRYDPHVVAYRLREKVLTTLANIALTTGAINIDDNERVQALESLTERVEVLRNDMLTIWVDAWMRSEAMQKTISNINERLETMSTQANDWRNRWVIVRVVSGTQIDRDIKAWGIVLDDAWHSYTICILTDGFRMLRDTVAEVTSLLKQPSALPIFEGFPKERTGPSAAALKEIIAGGISEYDTAAHALNEEQRRAMVRALRSLLTVDNVPATVWLTANVEPIRKQAKTNRVTVIDQARLNGAIVAVKYLQGKESTPRHQSKLLIEGAIWRMLKHPNILPFYGIIMESGEGERGLGLVSQWAANGDIMTFLKIHPNSDRRLFVKDIANAIAYLHSLDIAHGSIRGQNILIDADHRPMLTDFGLTNALVVSDDQMSTTTELPTQGFTSSEPLDTIRWWAPELIRYFSPTKSSDIFSFGRTILEIMTGEKPFKDENVLTVFELVRSEKQFPTRPMDEETYTRGLTEEVWNLLVSMWQTEPKARPDITNVCEALATLMG